MNKRDFIKNIGLGVIAAPLLSPAASLFKNEVELDTSSIPLYKEFDWLSFPSGLLFRTENHNGVHYMNSIPFSVGTYRTKIISDVEVDYTKEAITKEVIYDICGRKTKYSQLVYINEKLLEYAKEQGFTHLYTFHRLECPTIDPVTDKPFVCYFLRGLKMPDWKTVNGKLQIVDV